MRHQRKIALRESLLTRYSDSLGELMMRRRSEQAMVAARAESDLANRAKSAFLATVSHELRTPLNSIIGFSDVIQSARDEPGAQARSAAHAAHIAQAGRRLLTVVTDILDLSKLESGNLTLSLQPCKLDEIIDDSVNAIRQDMAAKNQLLDVRVPRDLPTLSLDFKRIKQVLANLLSNASKFTGERGRIILVAKRTPEGGATVAVADTGAGMSADQVAIALRPFGQIQSHLSRSQEGTGLGLPIARGLARLHGGDVHLESQPGAGTTVFLTLPALAPAQGTSAR